MDITLQGLKEKDKMTHEDAGNYAGKRRGAELNEVIAGRVKEKATDQRIPCTTAHSIAAELGVSAADVGIAVDLLEIRIIRCQLGLFGYAEGKNIPALSNNIDPEIESVIQASLVNGRLACSAAWEISERFHIPKPMVSAICESLKIKISPCQLGAFG